MIARFSGALAGPCLDVTRAIEPEEHMEERLRHRGCLLGLAVGDALGAPVDLPIRIRLLISFVFAFTLAIAIAKDLPDTEGDRQHAIPTFALRFGRIPALRTATALFAAAIICLIVAGVIGVPDMDGRLLAAGNAPIVILLVARARRVERAVDDPAAVAGFYRLVWAAFTAEYVIFSVACLIR